MKNLIYHIELLPFKNKKMSKGEKLLTGKPQKRITNKFPKKVCNLTEKSWKSEKYTCALGKGRVLLVRNLNGKGENWIVPWVPT